MRNKQKVVVAMSGGVDSSVAAALLKEQGYEVIGVTLKLFSSNKENNAAAAAKKLGIQHYYLDLRQFFQECVIKDFIDEYKKGRTPNPCTRCNPYVKFDHLLREANRQGADFIASGHYTRVVLEPSPPIPLSLRERGRRGGEGCWRLLKGIDRQKDQSYMLYRLDQEQLTRTIFPLGEMNKEEVRQKAKQLDLPVDRTESQDVCFIADDDYAGFLKDNYPEAVRPGNIIDTNGGIVGQHEGIAFYTLGQRKGVGHHRGLPKYVVSIDREKNTIIIGDQEDTFGKELTADQVSYVSGQAPKGPLVVTAKIRYNSPEAEAVLEPGTGGTRREAQGKRCGARIIFKKPQQSITPGQSVVFYKGEEVVGGGIIN